MTRFRHDPTISSKLTAVLVLTAFTGFVVALIAILSYELLTHQRHTQQRLTRLATTMALHTKVALAMGDRAAATEMLDALRLDEDVVAARVYDATGQVLATYERGSFEATHGTGTGNLRPSAIPPNLSGSSGTMSLWATEFRSASPILQDGAPIGNVVIDADLGSMWTDLLVQFGVIGLGTLVSLGLALVLASRLRPRSVTMAPTVGLAEATAAPGAGDPAGTPMLVADAPISTAGPASDAPTRESEPSPLAGRALLAEDNPVNQTVARCMLESLGLVVDVAANGREAVERVAAARYDLVLMDCQMPELDGFGATAEIRRREQAGGTRTTVVALTAHTLDGDRASCIAAGMDDYLSKPFTRERLAATLKRWLPETPTAREVAVPGPSPETPVLASTTDAAADPPLNPRALDTILRLPGDNGAALVNKVIRAYLADAPARLAQMHAAADAGNAEGLRKAAHSMKSSSANVGAERLAGLCKDLETMGRNGTIDAVPHLLKGIATELNRVLAALRDQVAEGSENALA
jgi:CheY-like chemotaxis protein/HPt (histidine-containing phosphotransfer) domain-containing protein